RLSMEQPLLAFVGLVCVAAAAVWGRSARYRLRILQRLERDSDDADLQAIAQSDFRKDLHTATLYGLLAIICWTEAIVFSTSALGLTLLLGVPGVGTLIRGGDFVKQARREQGRTELERRAQEVLVQDELAPRRWAERLAPDDLPELAGFELG